MSVVLTRLAHPGPPAPDRRQAAGATLRPLSGRLAAGRTVMAEVAALFAAHGCRGGIVWLDGVACEPMRFVLPALATDGEHAAFYSETHAPDGVVLIGPSTASVGWRDGAAFLHCHGQWSGAFGTAMGHLLPFDSILAEDVEVRGIGSPDAWFEALPDPETNFTLFAAAGGGGERRADRAAAARRGCLRRRRGALRRRTASRGRGCMGSGRSASRGSRTADMCAASPPRCGSTTGAWKTASRPSMCRWWTWMAGFMPDASQRDINPVGVTFELLIEALR